jgi:hypothetical protein
MAKTAIATQEMARGTERTGSRASSARFETVSMPVYAIIATGIASAKFDHVGAVPKWMFVEMTCGEKISTNPSPTSSSCVAKSSTASRTLRFAASLMPMMLTPTSSQVSRIPTITSHGVVRSGSQKMER